MSFLLLAVGAWLCIGTMLFLAFFRRTILQLWAEPVLRVPVIAFESDDWGPGPESQAPILQRIAQLLASHRDSTGHPAVMTIGVILAIPDGAAIFAADPPQYARRTLDDPVFRPILSALVDGEQARVFALQLHGMEHFFPDVLMRAAQSTPAVAEWLKQPMAWETEPLPPPLQSRWIEGDILPSRPIADYVIAAAVQEEVTCFEAVFGFRPSVVVPPTFIWQKANEQAWSDNGVKVLMTPGRRLSSRGADGRPVAEPGTLANGMHAGKMMILVRDDYFEPTLGHTPDRALQQLTHKVGLGRPTFYETHRFNFTGGQAESAFEAVDALLKRAILQYPTLRFTSPAELAKSIREGDRTLIDGRFGARIRMLLMRLREVPGATKLGLATGAALPAVLYLFAYNWLNNKNQSPSRTSP